MAAAGCPSAPFADRSEDLRAVLEQLELCEASVSAAAACAAEASYSDEDYDPGPATAADALIAEIDAESPADASAIQALSTFVAFATACHIPKKLVAPGQSANALSGFVRTARHRLGKAAYREKRINRLAHEWIGSSRADEARADAADARRVLVTGAASLLALSDHVAVAGLLDLPSPSTSAHRQLRVASHNIQEHVRDGVTTYVCSLPSIKGSKGSGKAQKVCEPSSSPLVPFFIYWSLH